MSRQWQRRRMNNKLFKKNFNAPLTFHMNLMPAIFTIAEIESRGHRRYAPAPKWLKKKAQREKA